MGNSIAKKFDIPKDHTASAGHCQLWKIWPATSKQSGKEVSVWVFDKADLAKRKVPITDKTVLEQLHQIMRKDLLAMRDLACSNIMLSQEVSSHPLQCSLPCVDF